ncbi:MAG: ABC transporter ATP-binding protein [Alphaproteobacteria bacterium]|nr:ABC transporter ATP-binding protein [Alphaproteobacteria bacterium]
MTLLSVRDLRVLFGTEHGEIAAVDDVGFDLAPGEILGVVGESGSGKSVTALAIMGLLPKPPSRIGQGSIHFQGQDLLQLGERDMRRIRGPGIGMIFQEPMTSLNPVFTIGDQLMETVRVHQHSGPKEQRERAVEMLARVGIALPARRLDDYPHQLSGGMRQRVMIAMALICNPKILIADEPTTALDVTIQQQILELLLDLRDELGMGIVIITHNMGVVAEMADRVIVMYAGKIVERAPVNELFERPVHPYTRGLLDSIPSLADERERLKTIPGTLPRPWALPAGCRFQPRCRWRVEACASTVPPLGPVREGHESACLRQQELAAE